MVGIWTWAPNKEPAASIPGRAPWSVIGRSLLAASAYGHGTICMAERYLKNINIMHFNWFEEQVFSKFENDDAVSIHLLQLIYASMKVNNGVNSDTFHTWGLLGMSVSHWVGWLWCGMLSRSLSFRSQLARTGLWFVGNSLKGEISWCGYHFHNIPRYSHQQIVRNIT
jgi:hypothetical protein